MPARTAPYPSFTFSRGWALIAYKRKSDREPGKDGKYTAWWIGEYGKKKSCVGTTKRGESLGIARDKEYLARQVRLGLIDPAALTRRDEGQRPVPEHLEDFRLDLIARGDTARATPGSPFGPARSSLNDNPPLPRADRLRVHAWGRG
jgi:hypothetical protein